MKLPKTNLFHTVLSLYVVFIHFSLSLSYRVCCVRPTSWFGQKMWAGAESIQIQRPSKWTRPMAALVWGVGVGFFVWSFSCCLCYFPPIVSKWSDQPIYSFPPISFVRWVVWLDVRFCYLNFLGRVMFGWSFLIWPIATHYLLFCNFLGWN